MAKNKGTLTQASATQANPKVDGFLRVAKRWREEMVQVRAIVREFGLTEELKWRWPCYTLDGANIVLIHAFKEYCALMIFKGALLKDPKKILAQPGSIQAARQIRFSSLEDVAALTPVVKAYIREAIEVEKAGLKVELKKTSDYPVPAEFQERLDRDRALKAAFEALTPGRQKGYLFHFNGAKQPQTRVARVEKCVPKILAGKGFDEE